MHCISPNQFKLSLAPQAFVGFLGGAVRVHSVLAANTRGIRSSVRKSVGALLLLAVSSQLAKADIPYVTEVTAFGRIETSVGSMPNVGMRFTNTTGTTVTITQLGRWVLQGNKRPHVLSIYSDAAQPVLLASVAINCAGATPNQFLYGTLATPYVVPIGASVHIVSSETTGGDTWYNNNGTVVTRADIGTNASSYVGGTAFNAGNNGGTYTSAGPVSFKYSYPVATWTKAKRTYTTDGAFYQVNSAISNASPGDTIIIKSGEYTWGEARNSLIISKAITLLGQDRDSTIINISTSAPTFGSGAVTLAAPATIGRMTIKQGGGTNTTAITAPKASGWRITDVVYTSKPSAGYFLYAGSYGLVDHCTINGGSGSDEWIFTRGPSDSWQTESSWGTADAVYLEDCTFRLQGYADFNSNARAVVRFSTFEPTVNYVKLDAHGYTTNTPARSARHVEIYNNHWKSGNSLALEIRGGSGVLFNNTNAGSAAFILTDYGYQTNLTNYGRYATAFDYPLIDQVGRGKDGGSREPAYVFGNRINTDTSGNGGKSWPRVIKSPGNTSSYTTAATTHAAGATVITLASGGGGSGQIGAGDAVAFAGDTNRYLVTSGVAQGQKFPTTITLAAPGLKQTLPASTTMTSGPQILYQKQTNNSAATFTESDIIKANRDFFASAGFDTATGITTGTYSEMQALTPAVVGYGFWVTDRGSWNQKKAANTSGQLYAWTGSAWVLKYMPYDYPHPLQRPADPSPTSLRP